MTQAPRALNPTQSASSAAIAALEAQHSIQLFHRIARGITLSEAGRVFLGDAQVVLAWAEASELALAEFAGLPRRRLIGQAKQDACGSGRPGHGVMLLPRRTEY